MVRHYSHGRGISPSRVVRAKTWDERKEQGHAFGRSDERPASAHSPPPPRLRAAGAALEVSVGHFSDPDEVKGIAHFLEHMLFLGTAKYPSENEYSSFLNDHGGYSNAYTASEQTQYQFEVAKDSLREALDRFSQFFVAPLFSASATSRELEAVDSEHSKNLQSDMVSLHRVHLRGIHSLYTAVRT
jgi:secreted Zn-dependent insulinase-like peptidase